MCKATGSLNSLVVSQYSEARMGHDKEKCKRKHDVKKVSDLKPGSLSIGRKEQV